MYYIATKHFKKFPFAQRCLYIYPQLFFTYYRTTFLTAHRDNVFAGSGGYMYCS
jgi:hypothetical protein